MKYQMEVPIRIHSELNMSHHWSKKYKRKKAIQNAIRYYWRMHVNRALKLPVLVSLTRVAPRSLDYDNLVGALKTSVDTVCDLIKPGLAPGQADSDENIKIEYHQTKFKMPNYYALIIEVEDMGDFLNHPRC